MDCFFHQAGGGRGMGSHIITQTPHFVLSEGGFVFVSEPICDVG